MLTYQTNQNEVVSTNITKITTKDRDFQILTQINLATGSLNGIGTAQDEITETELKKVIGSVDLGTFNFIYQEEERRFRTQNVITNATTAVRPSTILCAKYQTQTSADLESDKVIYMNGSYAYIQDHDFTNATTFKQSLSGVMLYYELAIPVITAEGFGEVLFKVQRDGTIETDNNGDLTLNQVVYKPVE
jgi:hypothetical protein